MPPIGPLAGQASSDDDVGTDKHGDMQHTLFKTYLDACGAKEEAAQSGDDSFHKGLERVKDFLSTSEDNSCCLICLGAIKPTEAIWHCADSCFAVMHLVCVQEWARNQLEAAALSASRRLDPRRFPDAADAARASADWGCPKCRHAYPAAQVPSTYTCFCGVQNDPTWDPWLTPHSCGGVCSRPLSGGCGHRCLLLCHPGPCPPCPLVIDVSCPCGKRRARRRCGRGVESCGVACGRRLACGHSCRELCHAGPCPPCPSSAPTPCRCGAEVRPRTCAEAEWNCRKVCGRPLACGRHTCERECHPPDGKGGDSGCGECPFALHRSCPCGREAHAGLACDTRPPTCGATCGKALPCGRHTCEERCHYGNCPKTCRVVTEKSCRCGAMQRAVPCHQQLLCERRCGSLRPCGRHACKRRCCSGDCPPCEETCGRRLRCGNHRCPAPCHTGPCRPCPLTFTVTCACGATSTTLPCGAEGRAVPPRCALPCRVPAACRHAPLLPPHRCHYGPCPPCERPCAAPLPCGHSCAAPLCHGPASPSIPTFNPPTPQRRPLLADGTAPQTTALTASQPPAAAAVAAAAAATATACLPSCPPCSVPVKMRCVGGHEERLVACSSAGGPFTCGQLCGQPLPCGNHTCDAPCHALASASAGGSGGIPCRECRRSCGRERSCGHPCSLACHPGVCLPCQEPARTPCHCGKVSLKFPCSRLGSLLAAQARPPAPATAASRFKGLVPDLGTDPLSCTKPCHRQLSLCMHPCRAACHLGPCPPCTEEVTVRCKCKRSKERWPCPRVLAALQAASGAPTGYDDSTPLRLLPCGAACAVGAGSTATATLSPSPAAAADRPKGAAAAAASAGVGSLLAAGEAVAAGAAPAGAGGGGGGRGRLSRAEREEAARRKAAEQRRAALRRRLMGLGLWALVLLAGLALGFGLYKMLLAVDRQAQARWGASEL